MYYKFCCRWCLFLMSKKHCQLDSKKSGLISPRKHLHISKPKMFISESQRRLMTTLRAKKRVNNLFKKSPKSKMSCWYLIIFCTSAQPVVTLEEWVFCCIAIQNAMLYGQKYTPTHCLFCNFAGWVSPDTFIRMSSVRQGEDNFLFVLYLNLFILCYLFGVHIRYLY